MSVIQIALFIIILILLLIAFRNTRRLKGGIYTSWVPTIDNSKFNDEYKALIDRITEVIKAHIEISDCSHDCDYDYDKMRDEVKAETDYQKAIVDSLFAELKKVKIESYTKGNLIGNNAFRAMFIGLVEAYVHLYIIHGFKLQLERSIHAGAFNIVIFCNRDYVLRIRARDYEKQIYRNIVWNQPLNPKVTNKILKNSIYEHKRLLEIFKHSNRILKPICSSYSLYHDFDGTFVIEWSLNDRVLGTNAMNPIKNHGTFNDYIKCLLETNRIAHSYNITYLDYKIGNILWNPKTSCYCITDIDFTEADDTYVEGITHKLPFGLQNKLNYYKSNYVILKEIATIHSSKNIEEYNRKIIFPGTISSLPYSIEGYEFEDEDLKPLIDKILSTKIN